MKIVAIVQARMGSSRFPNKVMQHIGSTPMIGLLLQRLSASTRVNEIVLATSADTKNDLLASYVLKLGHQVYRGSETDVLDRYYQAARATKADIVVRITGDCPLVDASIVDAVITRLDAGDADYACNVAPPTYPDGLDTEVFSFAALERAWNEARREFEREHVTPYIRESGIFRVKNVAHHEDHSAKRWTVDEPADLDVVRQVYDHFFPRTDFGWLEVLALTRSHPNLFEANRHIRRF